MAQKVLSVPEFQSLRAEFGDIVHIKGFDGDIEADWKGRALQAIGGSCSIAWDGDPPKRDSFTALVEIFLRSRPDNVAIAFRDYEKLDTFRKQWEKQLMEFGSRIVVVSVDKIKDKKRLGLGAENSFVQALPDGIFQMIFQMLEQRDLPVVVRDQYVLGRIAINCTSSKQVVCVGGGGIEVEEAAASFKDDVHWTIFGVDRILREDAETVFDWALDNPSPNVHTEWCGNTRGEVSRRRRESARKHVDFAWLR